MKIIGIDASLTSTGVAVIDGTIRTERIQSRKAGPDRLIEIRDRVYKIAEGADIVVIEGYAYASGHSAHQMGELGGVIRVLLREMELKVLEVSPGQLKKFATGKGNADKMAIAVAVLKRWKKEFTCHDEADAFILAMIGQAYRKGGNDLTAFQAEVIFALANGTGKKTRRKILTVDGGKP